MRFRLNPWVVAAALILVCAGVAGIAWKLRERPLTPGEVAAYLPPGASPVIAINLVQLRDSGILDVLAGSRAEEEADYKAFIDMTGFDYRNDLDQLIVAFRGETTFVLLSGRYEWPALREYAKQNGGICQYALCRMDAGDYKRKISFYPVRPGMLALAAGPSEWSAAEIEARKPANLATVDVDSPLMVALDSESLAHPERLPAWLQPWIGLVDGADRVVLTAGRGGDLELQMRLHCPHREDVPRIEARLKEATAQLRRTMEREGRPVDGKTFPGVLAGGEFKIVGDQLEGHWPMDRDFIQALAGGRS